MKKTPDFNRNKTMIVLFIVLLIITLSISAISIAYTLNNQSQNSNDSKERLPGENDNEAEDEDEEQNEEPEEDKEDSEQEEEGESNGSNNTPSNQGDDMTSGWNTYYNSKWGFGLKYPKDMVYTESFPNPTLDRVEFVVGGEFTVISIHVADDDLSIDNQVKNMLANQCTDDFVMSNLVYPNATFRKGIEVPNETCLNSFGITRDQDYSAYAYQLDSGAYLIIRNEGNTGLNEEQLEALLKSVYFE